MINTFIIFSIETLFFTNLWVYLYVKSISLLNSTFTPISPSGFIRQEVAPEPFEIPIYIFLSILTVFSIWLYYKKLKPMIFKITNKSIRTSIGFKLLIFILLLLLFISNLGKYPMAHDLYPYSPDQNPITYLITFFIYVGVMAFILIETALMQKMFVSKKLFFFLFTGFLVLIVAIILFEPRFPISGLDYSYFFGSIWEISQGKTIFNQVSSQYGFLSIMFFALLHKLGIFSLWNLPVVIWLLYIIEYFINFYLVYKISKSLVLALIALFSLITLNYFSLYLAPSMFPQIGPLRWLPIILLPLLLHKIKRIDSKYFIFFVCLLSFWIVDNGIAILLSYLFSLCFLLASGYINFKQTVKTVISFGIMLFIILFVLNILQLIFHYQIINLGLVFLKLKQYASAGYGMIPIEYRNYFWLVILAYLGSIIYLLRRLNIHNPNGPLLIFTSNLALFSSIYFVGRSHPHNLYVISPIFLLNLFLLISINWPRIKKNGTRIILAVILFFLLVVLPTYERQEIITKSILDRIARYQKGNIFKVEAKEYIENKYSQEIKMIKNNFQVSKILLLSDDDSYLLYLTGKNSFLRDNPQDTILTEKDIDYSIQDVIRICPHKIIADCRIFQKCPNSDPYVLLYAYIQPNIMQKIEKQCHIKYKPLECTNHLCIGLAK